MQLCDRLTLDTPRITKDGFMAVRAKAARTGIYEYLASEFRDAPDGLKPNDVVKIYRDADQVFDRASVGSFNGRAITDGHPNEPVTASNWRDHARGVVLNPLRDGEFLGFDLLLMDAATIAAVKSDNCELSNGYNCDIDWTAGTTADGQAYHGRQTNIRGNHVAIVPKGRAGPDCRIPISDRFAVCDANTAILADLTTEGRVPKTITMDGLTVNLGDEAAVEAAIAKLNAKIADGATALTDAVKAHDQALAAKDAEIDALKAKVVDQAQIDALAEAKSNVVTKAKAILGDKMPDTAGKSVADVRRMVCAVKLGDAAVADKSDDYVEAYFDNLTADTTAVKNITPMTFANDVHADEAKAYAAIDHNAWRNQA